MPRSKSAVQPPAEVPFEEALARVEELVRQMDAENLPLDQMIRLYEEGTAMIRTCQQRLTEAQQKVERITQGASGTLTVEPLEQRSGPAEAGAGAGEDFSSTDDDTPF